MTLRRRISQLLAQNGLTARGISQALGISEKEVYEHLPHVQKSLGKSESLISVPARCMDCGFVFRKRKRFTTPGKCPVCRSESITPPVYSIAGEGGKIFRRSSEDS